MHNKDFIIIGLHGICGGTNDVANVGLKAQYRGLLVVAPKLENSDDPFLANLKINVQ